MADLQESVQKEIESLKQVRDELRVKADLAKMETRDQWETIEKKWHHLEGQVKSLNEDAKASASEIGDAVSLVLGEIKEGYTKIKEHF
jgi:hypothetical protein